MSKLTKAGRTILQLLKERGDMTVKQLAEKLEMTTMGVRQHLQQLEQEGELVSYDEKALRGRPTRFWQLTPAAQRHFEDRHEELTVQLLISVKQVFGEQGLDKLIAQREADSLALYQDRILPLTTVKARLDKLAEMREQEGYMASVEQNEQGYLLLENHCPICAAATACMGFCRSELSIFQSLFQDLAAVTRTEHIIEGARRCAYQVTPI